jgi:pimeloyl-ACP methyl ester carboxylesterase
MGQYIDIGGVNTWYDEQGSGEPLVLLHGGLCTNETWSEQAPVFAAHYRVLMPERRGHGHTADVDGPLSYTDMANDTIGFLDEVVGGPSHLVGWSDGGIVGLMVAIARPDLVRKLVTFGANYDADGVAPEAEEMLANMSADGPDMEMFRGLHAMHSPDGPDHWPVFFAKFVEMLVSEPHIPVSDLARISAPTLVLVGDDDMVALEHTVSLYRAIPDAQLAVVPGASHMVVMEKPDVVNRTVLDFLESEPAETMMPLRRSAGAHG